jgi:hypothetical protein
MWEQKRTERVFQLVQYNWVLIPILVGCVYHGTCVLANKVMHLIYLVLRRFWKSSYIIIDDTTHITWSSLLCTCKLLLLYIAVTITLSNIMPCSSFWSSQSFYCRPVPCILLSPETVSVIETTRQEIFQKTSHLSRNSG